MTNRVLFQASGGRSVTSEDLRRALRDVRAPECDVLYVHSEMSFGMPAEGLRRRDLLEELVHALNATGAGTIVMPAFTFSFCNGEEYDRGRSKSMMGALNEYFRGLPDTERSADPLLSVALAGKETALIRDLPHTSLGRGSTFDRIHRMGDRVRFLFLGVDPAKCFTYIHYVEKCAGVPYRYDREFTGTIVDGSDRREETWTLFVRYRGVEPSRSRRFVEFLQRERLIEEAACGDASIFCIDEPSAYAAVEAKLAEDIDYFLDAPYPRGEKDTFFHAEQMVAL